jgi:thiol-disulfide isomerase/thioredoxin
VIYFILLFFLVILGCEKPTASPETLVIEGTVHGDTKGYQTVYIYSNPLSFKDSALIQDGTFRYETEYRHPVRYLLYSGYDVKEKGWYVPMGLLIDQPGEIKVELNIEEGFHQADVSGLPTHAIYEDFQRQCDSLEQEIHEILLQDYDSIFLRNPPEDSPLYSRYEEDLDRLERRYFNPLVKEFIHRNPGNFSSAFILSRYDSFLSLSELEALYAEIRGRADFEGIYEMTDIAEHIQGLKNSAIGSKVEDFPMQTPDGEVVDFGAFRGKHVLLDFWASWCMPCIRQFPHLKNVYDRTESSEFEIVSISIDRDRGRWEKALEKYRNPWPQFLDTAEVHRKNFAVSTIPALFLINPEGEIIAKDLDSLRIEEELAKREVLIN